MIIKQAVEHVQDALAGHHSPTRTWLIGVPWFEPPAAVLEGLRQAGAATSFPYPPPQGFEAFREAICLMHERPNAVPSPDQIVITHGAKGGLTAVLGCLLRPGDELLHPTPSYPAYAAIARALGAIPVPMLQQDGCYSLTRELLEEHLTSRTRAIVLSSPCNPTGAILAGAQAELTVAFCRRHNIRLICDEAYAAFAPPEQSQSPAADCDPYLETVIQIRSFSKTFAVCGWRIGYVLADEQLARDACRWQSAMLNPANSIAQKALLGATRKSSDILDRNRNQVRSRLVALAAAITGTGFPVRPPEGGFYLWMDIRPALAELGIESSLDFCCRLARQSGVGLWPGEDFGGPGFVRISVVGCPDHHWEEEAARLVAGLSSIVTKPQP